MKHPLPIKDKSEDYKYIRAAVFDRAKRKTSPHKHNKYLEIVYLSKGSGCHYIGSHKYEITPPMLYFVKKEQAHHWELTQEPEGFVIILKKEFFDRIQDKDLKLLLLKNIKHDCLYISDASSMEKLMQLLVKENNNIDNENGFPLAEGLLKSLFAKILTTSAPAAPGCLALKTVTPSEENSNAVFCVSCTVSGCLLKNCSADWLRIIDLHKYQTFYKQGCSIYRAGSAVLGTYFILKGKVKLLLPGAEGKEQIVRLASAGQVFGLKCENHDCYPVSAVVMEDSLVCFIENKILEEALLANPKFADSMMMYYSQQLRKIETRMKNIVQMNLREKTAEALLYLHESFGLNKTNEINVPFSREELAGIAGSTRQQVTMQLHDFEKEGLIKKRGKRVSLPNVEALRRIIS